MELLIYGDCKMLLDKFLKSSNITFVSFAKEWNELKFANIWAAQSRYIEQCQATAAVLHFAKRYACGRYPNGKPFENLTLDEQQKLRIGGVFLMYAIFFKQPLREFVKIEVAPDTWNTLQIFIVAPLEGAAFSGAEKELKFIFSKLWTAHAFSFAAVDHSRGCEGLIDYDNPPLKFNGGGYKNSYTAPNLTDELSLLPEIEEILKNIKEKLQHCGELVATEEQNDKVDMQNNAKKVEELSQMFNNILKNSKLSEDKPIVGSVVEKRNKSKEKAFVQSFPKESESSDDEENNINNNTTHHHRRITVANILSLELPSNISKELDDAEKTTDEE